MGKKSEVCFKVKDDVLFKLLNKDQAIWYCRAIYMCVWLVNRSCQESTDHGPAVVMSTSLLNFVAFPCAPVCGNAPVALDEYLGTETTEDAP